jgi:vacuolar-type H+-ATPase subunit H
MDTVDKMIEQAKKQAEKEAAQIIGEANRRAKQIAEKAAANAEKAQYAILTESRAIAKETTTNIEQLTDALVTMQEDVDDLVGVLGEQAHALSETANKLETAMSDTIEKTHREIDARLQVIRELNQRFKRVVEGTHRDGEKEVEHTGKDKDKELGLVSSERKEPIAQPAVSAAQSTVSPPSDEDRQFLGTVELVIISPNSPELRRKFLNCLPAAAGLDLQGSPESVGKKRTQSVYLPKPVPLVKILRQMAMVKSANEDGRGIIEIVLEAVDQWRG